MKQTREMSTPLSRVSGDVLENTAKRVKELG
jgi:hypothetical protein